MPVITDPDIKHMIYFHYYKEEIEKNASVEDLEPEELFELVEKHVLGREREYALQRYSKNYIHYRESVINDPEKDTLEFDDWWDQVKMFGIMKLEGSLEFPQVPSDMKEALLERFLDPVNNMMSYYTFKNIKAQGTPFISSIGMNRAQAVSHTWGPAVKNTIAHPRPAPGMIVGIEKEESKTNTASVFVLIASIALMVPLLGAIITASS